MATKDEDFSFPTTTNPPPRFIGSPPLWQLPEALPASYPGTPAREDGASKAMCTDESISLHHQRRSFSRIEDCKKMMMMRSPHGSDLDDDDDGDDVEEKMDMLWEDFNEEFTSRITKSRISGKYMYGDYGHGHEHEHVHDDGMSPKGMANMGCVRSLKLSKATKRPGLVVFMKVLKKFFLLQNSHRSFKKKTQW